VKAGYPSIEDSRDFKETSRGDQGLQASCKETRLPGKLPWRVSPRGAGNQGAGGPSTRKRKASLARAQDKPCQGTQAQWSKGTHGETGQRRKRAARKATDDQGQSR